MELLELQTKYDARASFYGKAKVAIDKNTKTLYSYDTKIMSIDEREIITLHSSYASATTDRHIREFLKQFTFFIETKDSNKKLNELIKKMRNEFNKYV